MSDTNAVVVKFDIEKIADSDFLSVAKLHGKEWQVVVRTDDFKDGKGVYIPLDALCDTARPEFAFLDKGKNKLHRIKTIRLRKVLSQGLLIPCPPNANVGDDLTEALGITRYEPRPPPNLQTGQIKEPTNFDKYTSIENFKNYPRALQEGESVRITCKIHGSNWRAGFVNGKKRGELWTKLKFSFFQKIVLFIKSLFGNKVASLALNDMHYAVGSHRTARKEDDLNDYSNLSRDLNVKEKLAKIVKESGAKQHFIVYGELYGKGVQTLVYDAENTKKLRLFDVKIDHVFQTFEYVEKIASILGIETVPILYRGPYSRDKVMSLRDGKDPIGNHIREGVVVTAEPERSDRGVGRVIIKFISDEYLEIANKKGWSDGH